MATILNLGCGTRTSTLATNIDFSIALRLKTSRPGRLAADVLLKGDRKAAYDALDGEIVVHDLRKGIPAETGSVDVVYHSHTLEHIDRDGVPGFFAEILRVLRPGGIHRIVVPDFEAGVRDYLASLEAGAPDHDRTLEPLLAQSVQREASGTSHQPPLRRKVENLLLGDARKRGHTHQWMYDRLNLAQVLEATGHVDVQQVDERTSGFPGWNDTGLDLLEDGTPYKPGSLYMEGRKPQR